MSADVRMPVVFFGHGSPMVALLDNATSRSWRALAAALPRPKAILSVSAHWETRGTAVTAMTRPPTIHDFGASFPQALFAKQYPAPGNPALARRVADLLAPTAQVALEEGEWGFDHGTWSVLVHAYPEADVPVVQLSLDVGLSPRARFEIGRALIPLRDEGVLILGTGNIVHNLSAMNWGDAACAPYDWAQRFNDDMRLAIEGEPERAIDFARHGRDAALAAPTPEHFWPLLYVLGARAPGDRAKLFNDRIEHGSLSMTSFVFEAA
jgi:4,5-DOPA dioxygenase extradiol